MREYLIACKPWTGEWSSPSVVKGDSMEDVLCVWWLSAHGEEVEECSIKEEIRESWEVEELAVYPMRDDEDSITIE